MDKLPRKDRGSPMSKHEPTSNPALMRVIVWMSTYQIQKYVSESESKQLKSVPDNLIWTEFRSPDGLSVAAGYENDPTHSLVRGYFIMKNPFETSNSPQIVQTYTVETCPCWGEDLKCPDCDGGGNIEIDLLALAKANLRNL
jgi:hypothetical protein